MRHSLKIMLVLLVLSAINAGVMLHIAYPHPIDLDIIEQLESAGDANAISYKGINYGAGAFQISKIVLEEFNQAHHTEHTQEHLLDYDFCYEVADWYLNRITNYLKHYDLEPSISNYLIAYNYGIGNLAKGKRIPPETVDYIQNYFLLKLAKERMQDAINKGSNSHDESKREL